MTHLTNTLECVEINPTHPADASVIWLHGLGADANDFLSIVPELHLPATSNVRFIFPNAPIMPVTINNGFKMRAWYDIYGIALAAKIDEIGITTSVNQINQLIKRETTNGIPSHRIILAGFSQGAVIALTAGLQYPQRLGGILALSGYLPLSDTVLANASVANQQLPIFIGHGTNDAIVPFELGNTANTLLKNAGYTVTWHSYQMPHSVCFDEIQDIGNWLQYILTDTPH